MFSRWNDSADRVKSEIFALWRRFPDLVSCRKITRPPVANPRAKVFNNGYLARSKQTGVCIKQIYDGLRSWGAKLLIIIAGYTSWRWLEPRCVTDAIHPHRTL